ncbi:helix-turn-helix domain-containing protein [Stieleria mannarensis]|uniref:helix-turn-helix domain-containing protein n=1 Tax=Stieleria mannarensis TaxID=2755585 RepID=UPI003369DBBE
MTPPEVAKLLRASPGTVHGWIRRAELRAVNVGSGTKRARYRVSRESLDEFIRLREVQPTASRQTRRRDTKPPEGGPIDPVQGKKLAKQGVARESGGKYYRIWNGVTQWY